MGRIATAELDLRAGEWVVVRSKEEILRTLDQQGRLEGLPFNPEMFAFCGRRLRVFKVAHKTCDTISKTGGRRMRRTVHLEEARCDGVHHGGCQADCLLYWKEAWLERPPKALTRRAPPPTTERQCTEQIVLAAAVRAAGSGDNGEIEWRCQATSLLDASQPLRWWDFRQYWRDVRTGNHSASDIIGRLTTAAVKRLIQTGHGYRLLVAVYNLLQKMRGGPPYTTVIGKIPHGEPTPTESLDLQPGEWVEVRTLEEIQATLHTGTQDNRGLYFDKEMLPFCGTRQRVKARIEKIIDERSGKLLAMKTPCIELEGVYCRALCSERRIGCPRAIPSYWREIWLRRAPECEQRPLGTETGRQRPHTH